MIYDLENNFFLITSNTEKAIGTGSIWTTAQINTLLNNISENLKMIYYTPCTLTMRGLPYVTLGDSLNVITSDSGFQTYVMRRTLSGIQSLTDTIEVN